MACSNFTKRVSQELAQLMKNVNSFTNGQVEIIPGNELTEIALMIRPNDGPYKHGTFKFRIDLTEEYPREPPNVIAQTHIFHPNIYLEMDDEGELSEGGICFSLLSSDWEENLTLEDVVQGLLFLLYNPNREDPQMGFFSDYTDEEFLNQVHRSLLGEEVKGIQYPRNFNGPAESEPGADEQNESQHEKMDTDCTCEQIAENIPNVCAQESFTTVPLNKQLSTACSFTVDRPSLCRAQTMPVFQHMGFGVSSYTNYVTSLHSQRSHVW